ncbi:MAG: hypothetical protein H6858_02825 [Rhodospirillales bacterium]|nr:hypothetical protein [Rhodospirillales bacterium]
MAGPNLSSPSELAAYLETVRQRQQVSSSWPADYMYYPVDGGGLTVGVPDTEGHVQNYSVWMKRDQPGGAFNSFVLLNSPAQFDALYRSLPSADSANTVTYADRKAWINANTGEVRAADVSEVYYNPGTGRIVPEENGLDYIWSQSGEFVDSFDAERLLVRHEARIERGEIPEGTPLTQEGKGELVRVRHAFVNSDLIRDGAVSSSDLATDLRSQGFEYGFPGTLHQTEDSQRKAAANEVMIAAFTRANGAIATQSSATVSPAALQGVQSVSVYQTSSSGGASVAVAAEQTPGQAEAAMSAGAFLADIQRRGAITASEVDAAKDDKIQMRAASRAITEIDQLFAADPKAERAETQSRILEAMQASPGQRDIIADYVRQKITDPSLAMNEHLGMVTGRMLGMRPAIGQVENIQPTFQGAAGGGADTIQPKNLSELHILPTGTDLAEDYNRAQEALNIIRRSATATEPQENKLPAGQIAEVIAAYRRAGYEGYARVMEDLNRTAASDPTLEYARASVALHSAYASAYDHTVHISVQADVERGRQEALQHLNVDYDDIRRRIPEILQQQGVDAGPISDEMKDEIMRHVRGTIDRIAEGFNSLTPERAQEIERTINARVEQAVTEEATRRLGNVDARIDAARQGAQTEYDARAQQLIEQIRSLPAEQRDRICTNAGNNPLVQAACKP